MNRVTCVFIVSSILFFSQLGLADSACETPSKSYQSIIACAEKRSPEVQSAELELEQSRALVGAAGQWQNPELAAESFQGKVGSEDRSETDISLGIPIEPGKVSARKSRAQSEVNIAEAKLYAAKAKVRSEILLKLHRLRQVLHEQEIAEEAIQVFTKLVNRYSNRPGLSPEQKISSSVFQLSKGEYSLKKSVLFDEVLMLDSYFKLTVGLGVDSVKATLPPSPKAWPKINLNNPGKISLKQRILQAEFDAAKAELSLAQSEAWPTFTLGPSVKMIKESGVSDQLVGFNLSFPLPAFNLNGGARSAAAAGVRLSESRQRFGIEEQNLKRDELLKSYEHATHTLTESLTHQEIENRHREAEVLFTRGIVPSSLVIEAHRTSFELEKARHERELKALEVFLELHTIDGTILEVNL